MEKFERTIYVEAEMYKEGMEDGFHDEFGIFTSNTKTDVTPIPYINRIPNQSQTRDSVSEDCYIVVYENGYREVWGKDAFEAIFNKRLRED